MVPMPFTMLINLAGLAIALAGAVKVFRGAASMSKREIIDMLQDGWAGGEEGKILSMATVIFTGSAVVQKGFKLWAIGVGLQLLSATLGMFHFIRNFGFYW